MKHDSSKWITTERDGTTQTNDHPLSAGESKVLPLTLTKWSELPELNYRPGRS